MSKNILLLGIMRGGSSIFAEVFEKLCNSADIKFTDPMTEFYNKNQSLHDINIGDYIESSNTVIGMCRELPDWIYNNEIRAAQKVLLVRDPRDCLLSVYNMRNIHSRFPSIDDNIDIPFAWDIDNIDHFVLANSNYFHERFEKYMNYCYYDPSIIVVKYENFLKSIDKIVNFALNVLFFCGYKIDQRIEKESILIKNTISMEKKFNIQEKHITSHENYQFTQKLKVKTIKELTKQFHEILSFFKYHASFDDSSIYDFNTLHKENNKYEESFILNKMLIEENGFRIHEISLLKQRIDAIEKKPRIKKK